MHGGLGKSLDWERSESGKFFLAKLVKRLNHLQEIACSDTLTHLHLDSVEIKMIPGSCIIEQTVGFGSPNSYGNIQTSSTVLVDYESRTIDGPRPLGALKFGRDNSRCDSIPTLQVTSRCSQSLRHVRPMRILPLCAILTLPICSVTLPPASTIPTSAFHVPDRGVCHSH